MRRRHITTAVTMLLLIGILVLGLIVGYNSLFKPLPGDSSNASTPSPSCTPQKAKSVHASEVQVSVFNAGTRLGLASTTLHALTRRGFSEGDLGNAPSGTKVRRVQVWTTVKHDAGARLVARQFGRRTVVRVTSTSLGAGINVVVGNHYHGLRKAPTSLRVSRSQQVCAPSASSS